MKWLLLNTETKESQRRLARSGESDRLHYLYKCYDCGRVITKVEVLYQRQKMMPNLCPCGSRAVKPGNAPWWKELITPRIFMMYYLMKTKQISPPPPSMTEEEQMEADRVNRAALRAFERKLISAKKSQ